jgi:hypothetical protein
MRTHRNGEAVEVPSYEDHVLENMTTMISGLVLGLMFLAMEEFPDGPPKGLTQVELALRLKRRLEK